MKYDASGHDIEFVPTADEFYPYMGVWEGRVGPSSRPGRRQPITTLPGGSEEPI